MNTPAPSPRLSYDQMHAVLTDWHAHSLDDPLYAHLDPNFEDMAGQLWKAMKSLKAEQEDADWMAQQAVKPVHPRVWLGLRELSGVAA